MSDSQNRSSLGLVLLAAIGAGTLSGALLGLMIVRRPRVLREVTITETVDDLKRRAEKILEELSLSTHPPIPNL
jgi:hypothetical protein